MRYELDRTPSLIRPPAFQPCKQAPMVRTVMPDIILPLNEWWAYHAERGRYMPVPNTLDIPHEVVEDSPKKAERFPVSDEQPEPSLASPPTP